MCCSLCENGKVVAQLHKNEVVKLTDIWANAIVVYVVGHKRSVPYYIRQQDIWQMSLPSRLSIALRKIIAAREHLVGQSGFMRQNGKQLQGDSAKIPWRRVTCVSVFLVCLHGVSTY